MKASEKTHPPLLARRVRPGARPTLFGSRARVDVHLPETLAEVLHDHGGDVVALRGAQRELLDRRE